MRNSRSIGITAVSAVLATVLAPAAQASCGASFCAVNTLWETQAAWSEPGARLDLRFEYIDQAQPRAGRDAVGVGQIPQHEDEVRTLNRNLVAALDYSFNPRWALSLQLPFVTRAHTHINNDEAILQAWDLDGLGDIRVLARRQLLQKGDNDIGMSAGIKLPTGEDDEANALGEVAERSLQSGTGTTDLIAGVYYNTLLSKRGAPLRGFAQLQTQYPLNRYNEFQPGYQYNLDIGLALALAAKWNGLLQLNTQIKGRDHGNEAEPDDTGGTFVWLNPGISYGLGNDYRVYGFVQLPLYQRVNGVQLTADVAYVLGMNVRF